MRRLVLVATGVALVLFAVAFLFLGRDEASWIATLASTLVGIAGLGMTAYAVVMPAPSGTWIRVARTGKAKVGGGGRAVTGYVGPSPDGSARVEVDRTGDAESSQGNAVTGVDLR